MTFSDPIIGGENKLIRTAIESPDYVAGVSGWSIRRDGTAEFNNVVVRGTVDVSGSSGSGILIDVSGGAPFIFFYTSNEGGITERYPGIAAAQNDTTDFPGTQRSYIDISGPGFNGSIPGNESSTIRLYSETADATSERPVIALQNRNNAASNNLEVQVKGDLTIRDRVVVQRKEVLNTAQAAGSTNVNTYSDMPATSSLSFTKLYDDSETKLVVSLTAGMRTGTAFTAVRIGVSCNGNDYDVSQLEIPDANKHISLDGTQVLTDIPAGTHTVQARWRRVSGAGNIVSDGNDWMSLTVEEIPV